MQAETKKGPVAPFLGYQTSGKKGEDKKLHKTFVEAYAVHINDPTTTTKCLSIYRPSKRQKRRLKEMWIPKLKRDKWSLLEESKLESLSRLYKVSQGNEVFWVSLRHSSSDKHGLVIQGVVSDRVFYYVHAESKAHRPASLKLGPQAPVL
jgi:hypothetical protein